MSKKNPCTCMPRRVAVFLVVAFVLALTVQADSYAEPVEILIPESLTDVSSDNSALVGEGRGFPLTVYSTSGKRINLVARVPSPAGASFRLTNNGRELSTPTLRNGYLHAKLVLSLGLNQIEVGVKRGSGPWETASISLFRSSRLEGGVSSDYPPYVFHVLENEELCGGCHLMRPSEQEIEMHTERSCLACHIELTNNVYVHGPIPVGICTICHDEESRPNRYVLKETDDKLCYTCHDVRKETDTSARLMHGPVGAGLCTVCHDPHSSPFEYQLVKSRYDICLLCHQEDYGRWIGEDSLHPPFKEGDCAACHDPHSSDYDYNLKASREDLCKLCHEIPVPGHLHTIGKIPQFKLPEEFPVDPEGKTICLTCHDPHGTVGPSLARRRGCDGCHFR